MDSMILNSCFLFGNLRKWIQYGVFFLGCVEEKKGKESISNKIVATGLEYEQTLEKIVCKTLHLWSLWNFAMYMQCFLFFQIGNIRFTPQYHFLYSWTTHFLATHLKKIG